MPHAFHPHLHARRACSGALRLPRARLHRRRISCHCPGSDARRTEQERRRAAARLQHRPLKHRPSSDAGRRGGRPTDNPAASRSAAAAAAAAAAARSRPATAATASRRARAEAGETRPPRREARRAATQPQAAERRSRRASAPRPPRRRQPPRRAPLPKAKRELLVSVDAGEKRVAVLEDGRVAEVYLERPEHRSIAGNIYLGAVDNVLPGMEAAFVEIGLEKNGFLYVDEIVGPELEGRSGAAARSRT